MADGQQHTDPLRRKKEYEVGFFLSAHGDTAIIYNEELYGRILSVTFFSLYSCDCPPNGLPFYCLSNSLLRLASRSQVADLFLKR